MLCLACCQSLRFCSPAALLPSLMLAPLSCFPSRSFRSPILWLFLSNLARNGGSFLLIVRHHPWAETVSLKHEALMVNQPVDSTIDLLRRMARLQPLIPSIPSAAVPTPLSHALLPPPLQRRSPRSALAGSSADRGDWPASPPSWLSITRPADGAVAIPYPNCLSSKTKAIIAWGYPMPVGVFRPHAGCPLVPPARCPRPPGRNNAVRCAATAQVGVPVCRVLRASVCRARRSRWLRPKAPRLGTRPWTNITSR